MAFQALCAPGLVLCGALLFGTDTVLAVGETHYYSNCLTSVWVLKGLEKWKLEIQRISV